MGMKSRHPSSGGGQMMGGPMMGGPMGGGGGFASLFSGMGGGGMGMGMPKQLPLSAFAQAGQTPQWAPGSVEAQNAASARERAMRGQYGFEGPGWTGAPPGQMMGGPQVQQRMSGPPPNQYAQTRSFMDPGMFGGQRGMQSPLDYAMMMAQQRGSGGWGAAPGASPGMPRAPGTSSPGLLQQQKDAAAKVAAAEAAKTAAAQAKALKEKQKQQSTSYQQYKNLNPLYRANMSYDQYMLNQQANDSGGA